MENRLAQLKRAVPDRGLERYPSILKSVAELPAELQSPDVPALAGCDVPQSIIAFPPQIHHGCNYVPKQALLFTPTQVIHLQASIWPDEEPRVTYIDLSGLMYVRVSLLLLYGFLEIVAQGPISPARLGLEFNTVAWHQIARPLWPWLQGARAGSSAGGPAESPAACRACAKLPLKFSNGVRLYGLLPGETLEECLFQPGTWKRWLRVFRRPVTANTLLLLTSNYVVVIKEELLVAQGWIFSYLPRAGIAGMKSRPRGLWNDVWIQLQRADQSVTYFLKLKREAAESWREKWSRHGGRWQDLSDAASDPGKASG
jgi:hypothetical protein